MMKKRELLKLKYHLLIFIIQDMWERIKAIHNLDKSVKAELKLYKDENMLLSTKESQTAKIVNQKEVC